MKHTKLAIACSGLGRVRRGFETFAQDLFHNLKSAEIDVTLLKGGGIQAPREIPLWNIHRNSVLWHLTGKLFDPYIGEQMTFALSVARWIKNGNFDLVHLSDGQLGSSLLRLFPGNSRKFRIVFSNGGPMAPAHYRRFDYVQQVNLIELHRALASGMPPERMALVPYGVATDRFHGNSGTDLRRQLEIPEDEPILLSVGAHGAHKRLDFLIRHAATVKGNAHLLVVGEESPTETPHLRALAKRLLGQKAVFAAFPHEVMPAVYAASDLYILCSLREGLSLTLVEAMASGLPVIHHDESAMNWIVGAGGLPVDMTKGEHLAEAVEALLGDSHLRSRLSQEARRRAEEEFSWQVLLPRYFDMYQEALRLPLNQ